MMKMKRTVAVLLVLAMLLGIAGCTSNNPGSIHDAPTDPTVDVGAIYRDAVAGLASAAELSLEITEQRQFTVTDQVFQVDSTLTLHYTADQQGKLLAEVSCNADYGSYEVEIDEIYANGTVYAKINDLHFSEEMTQEDFSARYVPAVMLDPDLYSTARVSKDEKMLTFSDATAPEAWLGLGEAVQLDSATGIVQLDAQGAVVGTTYEVTYQDGATVTTRKITARVCPAPESPIAVPTDTEAYTQIDFLDAVYTMEEAFALSLQAERIHSVSTETVFSQAFAVYRATQNVVDVYGSGKDQMIRTEQTLTQVDYSTGEQLTDTMEETFRDGKYTAVSNGEESREDTEVTLEVMRNHYQNLLLGPILDADFLVLFNEMTITDLGGVTLYEFADSADLDAAARANINYSLTEDPEYIDKVASDYRPEQTGYYVAIDNASGLYTAAGMNYSGYHTVAGTEYLLSMQLNQSFDLASLSAYENITGQTAPDEEPAEKPTPLFYKVTGADGQQMWLLGTIHVGDDRTAYLPQEIMDAFNSSDALAVELDVIAVEDAMENDEQLQAAVSGCYFYTDSKTSDHITDKELYAKAEKLMKAAGNYSENASIMKPALWGNALQQFYLQQGHRLSSEKGVDMRLLKLAKEQGKKIIEIESYLSQVQMFTGWTEPLQEALLKEAVEATVYEYAQQSYEQYALWCAGDQEALREMVLSDLETDDEDFALYEEYNKAMSTDRNALMLEAAKTYLESGETVFYAVGLAHLLAEDGLVYTLEEAGYTVELVTFQ